MTYEFCMKLVTNWNGRTDTLAVKIDVLYLMGRITLEQYTEIMGYLGVPSNNE